MPDLDPLPPVTSREISVRAVGGIAGYVKRAERLDQLVQAFDKDGLAYSDAKVAGVARQQKVAGRARDLARVSAFILGLAAAGRVFGEELSATAWAMASLAPALIFIGKAWNASERLNATDVLAVRALSELEVVEARHLWLERAARIIPLLNRRLGSDSGDDNAILAKATKAEVKLRNRLTTSRYAGVTLNDNGWGVGVEAVRRSLSAGIIVAVVNSFAFSFVGNTTVAIVCGLAGSLFAFIRSFASELYVERRAGLVSRLSVWNKQRDMLADIDKQIRVRADSLVSEYQRKAVIDLR